MDSVGFAGGIAPLLEKMRLLVAVRCGECGAAIGTAIGDTDQMLGGRLTINIISSICRAKHWMVARAINARARLCKRCANSSMAKR